MMKRITFVLCLMAALLVCSLSFAAHPIFTAAEDEAFTEVTNGHFIKARQLAEKILESDEDAIGGNYVMAYVFWEGEGNLTRAMQLLKKTISLFEKAYCPDGNVPKAADLQSWHQRLLKDLAQVYAELDQREDEIKVHERIAELYKSPLSISAVWPLLKLDRFDEARQIAERTINDKDEFFSAIAYNDLTAIADAEHDHLGAFRAGARSVEYSNGKSCVILLNQARSYMIFLDLDKAIEYLLKADVAKDHDCVTDPIGEAAEIYTLDGAWQRAITALQTAKKRPVEKRLVVQVEKRQRTLTARLLYAMGFSDRAWPLMKTVVDAPGRLGYDSLLKEQLELANAVDFFAISNDALKRADERLAAWKAIEPFWLFKSAIRPQVREIAKERDAISQKLWSTHQKAFKQSLNPKNLKSFLVPFYALSPVDSFAIVDLLGRRTAEFLIDYQENALQPEVLDAMKPLFDLLRAYIAWRDGDNERALELVDKFESASRKRTGLLVSQSRMIRADILRQQDKQEESWQELIKIYQSNPALFRQFDVKLPVEFDETLTNASDDDLEDAYDALKASPRLAVTEGAPFVISAQRLDTMIQICMSSRYGVRYACTSADPKNYSGDPDVAPATAEIVDNFHHTAFMPMVDLSQSDLHSLDGSPVQVSADVALEDLLGTKAQVGELKTGKELPDEP